MEVDRAQLEEDQRKLAKVEEQAAKKRLLDKLGSKRCASFYTFRNCSVVEKTTFWS